MFGRIGAGGFAHIAVHQLDARSLRHEAIPVEGVDQGEQGVAEVSRIPTLGGVADPRVQAVLLRPIGQAPEVIEAQHLARAVADAEGFEEAGEGEQGRALIDAALDDIARQVLHLQEDLIVGERLHDVHAPAERRQVGDQVVVVEVLLQQRAQGLIRRDHQTSSYSTRWG